MKPNFNYTIKVFNVPSVATNCTVLFRTNDWKDRTKYLDSEMKVLYTTPSQEEVDNLKYILLNIGADATSEQLKEIRFLILEGDHTQNPPSYFEGLKSVGDGVDEIVVESVNGGNLFEIVIRNSDDRVFVSPLLKYRVITGIGTGDIPEEEPKLLILDSLISKVHKLDVNFQNGISRVSQLEASENIRVSNEDIRISNEINRQEIFNSTIDRINTAIASGTNDLEVREARISMDGTVYDTLNQRISAIETNPYILFETVEG